MKKILFGLILASCFIFLASSSKADDEVRNLQLDTKAKALSQSAWVDDLRANNIIFSPASQFQIQVHINNLGNRTQTNIHITSVVPSTITLDMPDFTINQIAANQNYTQTLTATVKANANIYKDLTASTLKFHMTSDVGSNGDDSITFYTGNGTKVATASASTSSATPILPKTGSAMELVFGTAIALATGYGALKLRNLARGY